MPQAFAIAWVETIVLRNASPPAAKFFSRGHAASFGIVLPAILLAAAALGIGFAVRAQDGPIRLETRPFLTLPADVRHPEALAADPDTGDIIVGTFDASEPAAQRNNMLLRYSSGGQLRARLSFGPTPLTGMTVRGGRLYFLNFGTSELMRLPSRFTGSSTPEVMLKFGPLQPPAPQDRVIANPDGSQDTIRFGSAGFPAPNGLAFDAAGNLYISDSFQGAIHRIPRAETCSPCMLELVSRAPLLATTGALPFGANGLAIDEANDALYINNAGDGRVLKLHLVSGEISVVAESLLGADGLLLHDGLLWVAANQLDTVVAIDERGLVRVIAGRFEGIDASGAPAGLLFPAATVVSGRTMIVANLALPLTITKGDEWEERVTRWNLVQFDLPVQTRGTTTLQPTRKLP